MLKLILLVALVGQVDALGHVNAIRASYGLPGVSWDATAAATSARNNTYQAVGHFDYDGPQDSAQAPDTASAFSMWMASPAHRSMILDPGLVAVGYHQSGWFHTLTGRTTGVAVQQSYAATPGGYSYRESARVIGGGFHPFRGLLRRCR